MTKSIEVVSKEDCCACYACVNSCPKKCIHMEKDASGCIYPKIDVAKCVICNLCKDVCPVLKPVELNVAQENFAAYSKNEIIRSKSTSGGVATELAKLIIEHGGIVYGASSIGDEVNYVRIDKLDNLWSIQGSKYVHSHIEDCFEMMKNDLKSGQVVLMIGLPCQIAGARNYFSNKYRNLYLIDILCHGVPSQDCFKNALSFETKQTLTDVSFRDGNKYCLIGYKGKEEVFNIPYRASYWFNGFVEGYIFRENCYSCRYAGIGRCGDITLGDFWGIDRTKSHLEETDKGVNLVMINTQQGQGIWDLVCDRLAYEKRNIQEAIPYNHSLQKPAKKPNNYFKFVALCSKKGAKKALVEAYMNKTIFISLRRIVRKDRLIYKIVTSLPVIGNKLKEYPE